MPTKCSVSNCESYYSKGVPFFDVPSPLKYKFSSEKAELSKKRRKRWLNAMGIQNDSSEIYRICNKHFVSGKPALLEDSSNVDWVPTLQMRSSRKRHRDKSEEHTERRKDSSRRSHSSKRVDTHKSRQYSTKKKGTHSETRNKIKEGGMHSKTGKIDLKKFLGCKVLLDGKIQTATFKGTNGSGLTILQKHGSFTSDNVTVKETAINNTVLRIHLVREDLQDLKSKCKIFSSLSRRKRKAPSVSSFGRQIKKTSHFFEHTYNDTPSKTIRNSRGSFSSVENSGKQMRNRERKEDKNANISNKSRVRHELLKNSVENTKTLNKTISKTYRDKFKIKLFPRASSAMKKVVKNGTIDLTSDDSLDLHEIFLNNFNTPPRGAGNKTYYLKFSSYRYPSDGKLDYPFQKLVTDVKHMKLPAPSWKIKVIIKQGKISAITFTNKLALERCIGFTANNNNYNITIDNKPALLLGSPEYVRCTQDLEILLDIIQNIDSKNPMLFYK